MLRRIPGAELSEIAAPSVRSMVVPELPRLEHELASARSTADTLRSLRREFMADLERGLTMHAGRLGLPPEGLRRWLEQELARFTDLQLPRVRVHPSDAASLQRAGTHVAPFVRDTAVQLVPDPDITPGGCILEAERGTLDARVETKLALFLALLARTEAP